MVPDRVYSTYTQCTVKYTSDLEIAAALAFSNLDIYIYVNSGNILRFSNCYNKQTISRERKDRQRGEVEEDACSRPQAERGR